jgi:hypothetical protein
MNFNPRNIIVDICVNNVKGWDDNTIRSFVQQGYTIYKIRKNWLTISGRGTFGELAGGNSDTISYYRIKFPYTEQGKQMITWMMMQIGSDFKILDTTHRKEICFEDS